MDMTDVLSTQSRKRAFDAQDWEYVPDVLGRIGQGFFRHIISNNLISVEKYEELKRKSILDNKQMVNKENKKQLPTGERILNPVIETESVLNKFICSELVRQGMMKEEERKNCQLYAYQKLNWNFRYGYAWWAQKYVRLMRRSSLATRLIFPFAYYRMIEVSKRIGKRQIGSVRGAMICAVHDPVCQVLGAGLQLIEKVKEQRRILLASIMKKGQGNCLFDAILRQVPWQQKSQH